MSLRPIAPLALALAACTAAPTKPDTRADDPDRGAPVVVEVAPTGGHDDTALARRTTAVRFEVVAFATADGGAPVERSLPADLAPRAQFWPGNSGDVLERQIGEITQLLGGDALSTGWSIGDAQALADADQIALRVLAVEAATEKAVESTTVGRFSSTATAELPIDGKWYRIRFFPGGVWKEAQVQGYLHLGGKGPVWYRVDGLQRGLYGPQTRGYQKGDLFELRAGARPSGVKLYPLE